VSEGPTPLDKAVELVLTTGLLVSGSLLLAGLVGGRLSLLRAGILLLLLTPLARVVVVTVALLRRKDWLFALASLWILAVLLSSLWVAYKIERGQVRSGGHPALDAPGSQSRRS
jgi:hypothetical protein